MFVIANWPKARQGHWDALLPARAIENQCYILGVNRTGVANGQVRVAHVRAQYPFLRDRVTA